MQTLFISDLHLDKSRPDKIELFIHFLQAVNNQVDRLFILGDLFEFWIGDDDDSDSHAAILKAMKHLSETETKLYIMRGNRDFLLHHNFEKKTGVTLLSDPSTIELFGREVLIMHGDLLCTKDQAYQRFRKISNNNFLQKLFICLPRSFRKRIFKRGRDISKTETQTKSDEIMDVTQETVEKYMRKHNVHELIHGHTHRQAEHHFTLDGKPAKRIVLGDWYGEDSVLVYEKDRHETLRINDYLYAH